MVDAENRPKKFHLTFHSTNIETGWDLGPFAVVPAPGQMSPHATKYRETTKD